MALTTFPFFFKCFICFYFHIVTTNSGVIQLQLGKQGKILPHEDFQLLGRLMMQFFNHRIAFS